MSSCADTSDQFLIKSLKRFLLSLLVTSFHSAFTYIRCTMYRHRAGSYIRLSSLIPWKWIRCCSVAKSLKPSEKSFEINGSPLKFYWFVSAQTLNLMLAISVVFICSFERSDLKSKISVVYIIESSASVFSRSFIISRVLIVERFKCVVRESTSSRERARDRVSERARERTTSITTAITMYWCCVKQEAGVNALSSPLSGIWWSKPIYTKYFILELPFYFSSNWFYYDWPKRLIAAIWGYNSNSSVNWIGCALFSRACACAYFSAYTPVHIDFSHSVDFHVHMRNGMLWCVCLMVYIWSEMPAIET